MGRRSQVLRRWLGDGRVGVGVAWGEGWGAWLGRLRRRAVPKEGPAGGVPPWWARVADSANGGGTAADAEDNGNCRGRGLGRECRWRAARGGDHGHLTTDQIGRHS